MEPYITPKKLLQGKNLPVQCDFAIVCLCPMPKYFEQFKLNIDFNNERLFVQLHSCHVMFCSYRTPHIEINFIVCAEVYGGPVCASIIEELHYYGIKCVLGLGFVGSFDKRFNTGDIVQAIYTLAESGTTPHYNKSEFILGDGKIIELFENDKQINSVTVWTTNAIYREYKSDVDHVIRLGCHVVNMDTSHLFAVCKMLNMRYAYFATVSDLMIESVCEVNGTVGEVVWQNDLLESIENGANSQNILIDKILDKLEHIKTILC